jgi:hypothetical protein
MKTKILRGLVIARRWANTDRGERVIVRTLTSLVFIGLGDLVVLIAGVVCS